jgi:hypothetical protein
MGREANEKYDPRGRCCTFFATCTSLKRRQAWSRSRAETCPCLKRNVCIIIDHSDWGYSFCNTGCELIGGSKTVDMPLWWHNKSATSAQSQHYSAPSDMIQIWGWQIKSRVLSGASSRGTPCFHWNYRLLPLQLRNTVSFALSFHSGQRGSASHHRSPQHHTKRRQSDLCELPQIGDSPTTITLTLYVNPAKSLQSHTHTSHTGISS